MIPFSLMVMMATKAVSTMHRVCCSFCRDLSLRISRLNREKAQQRVEEKTVHLAVLNRNFDLWEALGRILLLSDR